MRSTLGSLSRAASSAKLAFGGLSLTFAPGALAPTLLNELATGGQIRIEVAT